MPLHFSCSPLQCLLRRRRFRHASEEEEDWKGARKKPRKVTLKENLAHMPEEEWDEERRHPHLVQV
jgi:hypothetical protein